MQRMVNQMGTHQDSPELRKQLYVLIFEFLTNLMFGFLAIPSNITPSNWSKILMVTSKTSEIFPHLYLNLNKDKEKCNEKGSKMNLHQP